MANCCKTYDPCLDNKLNQIGSYASAARQSAQNSASSAAAADADAAAAAASAAAAAISAGLAGIYLGAFAIPPTTDNTGGPLQDGMLYYNTVSNTLFVWNGSSWSAIQDDEIYLGGFAVAPTLNNQGLPLQLGNLYWNSVTNDLWAYDGVAWVVVDFNEFTPFLATGTTFARNLVTRSADVINVKDFGAVGDGVTDDTAAIQAAYAAGNAIVFPTGVYNVTHLTFTGGNKIITFQAGAKLYGVSATPQDSVLTLHNFRQSKIINLEIESDGTSNTPLYSSNYNCALRITSNSASSPSQFLTIDGLFIRYIKAGLVAGNFLGDPPQAAFPQSEIFIRDYKVRGVMQQLYQNALGLGLLTTTGCVFVTQKFEAGSWWDDAQCFNLRNDAGGIVSIGDEFQAARTNGFNIYGSKIKIIGPVWEHTCKNYITGSVSLTDAISGFFAQSSLPCFEIDPSATGELVLENVDFRRPDGTASFSTSVFVDAKNNNSYKTTLVNSRIKEFAYNVNAANAHFVLGGQLFLRNVTLDNSASTATSYDFTTQGGSIVGFDTTGEAMSTVIDLSAKGGLTATGSTGGFGKATADLPSNYTSSIRFNSVGSIVTVNTPSGTNGIAVSGGKDILLAMFLKRLGTTTNFTISANWSDYAGTAISSNIVFAANESRLNANGFDQWQQLRIAVKPPNNATHMSLTITTGSTCDVAVTGITLL